MNSNYFQTFYKSTVNAQQKISVGGLDVASVLDSVAPAASEGHVLSVDLI